MGRIAVVGGLVAVKPNTLQQAPVGELLAVFHGLQGLTNRPIVINGYGQGLGFGADPAKAGEYTGWTVNEVVAFIQKGGIWIDYTGWPMYYVLNQTNAISTVGASGFDGFANLLGYPSLAAKQFIPNIPYTNDWGFRGYDASGYQPGVYWPTGSVANPNRANFLKPNILYEQHGLFGGDVFVPMMALHYPAIGYYFYASASRTYNTAAFNHGVPASLLVPFVQNVLAQQVGALYQIRWEKYPTKPPSNPTPRPCPKGQTRDSLGNCLPVSSGPAPKKSTHAKTHVPSKSTPNPGKSPTRTLLEVSGVVVGAGALAATTAYLLGKRG